MKIDRSKVKKGTSEVPEDCRKIITFLKTCEEEELLHELQSINVWYFGKCELFHWIDVLDRFDGILANIAKPVEGKQWMFHFDMLEDIHGAENGTKHQNLIFQILKFTALLIEHSYARHLYNSIEHLITLLDCADGNIILAVLNLVYVFSKRSNYLTRLPGEKKKQLQEKLVDLAQTWGGSEAGCALQQCCSQDVPIGAGNVYFEYHVSEDKSGDSEKGSTFKQSSNRFCIDLKNVHQMADNVGLIMENVIKSKKIPQHLLMSFYHRLRLAHAMASYDKRLQFVQARLLALSILVYSSATTHVNTLVYDGLIEEIVNTLKISDLGNRLAEVKASCLKTLTAIIFLDRNPRLQAIIDATGAMSYHGFLPSLVRQCILHMTNPEYENFPQQLATALFSFLYHLASYEAGCEALVASSLIEPLLKVVLWPGQDDHITFVTRAVRVIDLITNLDMAAFQSHSGLSALVGRLQREVKMCSKFHGDILSTDLPLVANTDGEESLGSTSENVNLINVETVTESLTTEVESESSSSTSPSDASVNSAMSAAMSSDVEMKEVCTAGVDQRKPAVPCQYLPQRAALLKSILNFLKKAIPDPTFADNTRSLMDDSLQTSLKLIISNAEYYGALLFLLATDVVTVFIFHEPSLLSSLQDSGLTWVVLKALIVKDVPATRENLASLPNTLSALCLNTRGLNAFVSCKPFERLFRILISPEYLPAMKRRRSSDPQGDTAMHLGSAMDELMRHQPTLKTDAMKAIIQLLEQLNTMGHDENIIAFQPTDKVKPSKSYQKDTESGNESIVTNEDPLSDDEMEEEYRSLLIRRSDQKTKDDEGIIKSISSTKTYVPVVDYVLNVTKFLDNILSNNGTDDHCVEFVQLGGLVPLYKLLNIPNFPLEFPMMPACQSIAQVCKSVAVLAHESKVFKEGLHQLNNLIDELDSLYAAKNTSSSVLLNELAATSCPHEALYDSKQTPLIHAISSVHAYVNVFVFVCRGAQNDVRTMAVQEWGSELGKVVLEKLCNLYTKLVWESTVLLTLITPNPVVEEDFAFASDDLNLLTSKNIAKDAESSDPKKVMNQQTLMKWLLTSSSHLGRELAELFGLLVGHCVGTQGPRIRRNPNLTQPTAPSPPAKIIASLLTDLLVQGLKWRCSENIPLPRLRLTFHICAVGFLSPMLFDTSKNPYHLMLQQFEAVDGIEALFSRFNLVLEEYLQGKSEQDFKEAVGLGEFLENWLDLINRMIDTKIVFESTHLLPTSSTQPGFVPFNVVHYMVSLHKNAFDTIMILWKPEILKRCAETNGIPEQMLSILCHIIKGEKYLLDRFTQQNKQKEKTEKSTLSEIQKTPAPTTFHPQVEINEAHLQQFVDMGFSQEHATEALQNSRNNFEAATEYLLTTPAPVLSSTGGSQMDVDMSDDDLMVQAIAMSLGQQVSQDGSEAKPKSESTTPKKKMSRTENEEKQDKHLTKAELAEFRDAIYNYTCYILPGCLNLLDAAPSTVHNVCDLLLSISHCNGSTWADNTLIAIVEEIHMNAIHICEKLAPSMEVEEKLFLMSESDEAKKLTVRLHLFLLLFQDLQNSCAQWIQKAGCLPLWIHLLENITSALATAKNKHMECATPACLAPLLLIFDSYEKAALFWKRRNGQTCSHVWKWFDDRSGRWCTYSGSNNTSIDTAYHNHEDTVKFTAGRRRYMVFFKTLIQINEDTGNRRPIMLEVMPDKSKSQKGENEATIEPTKSKSEPSADSASSASTATSTASKTSSKPVKRKLESDKGKMDIDKKNKEKDKDKDSSLVEIQGLYSHQVELILEYSRELLGLPVNPITLNAIMRLSLRITRDHSMACEFANRGGIEYLLSLKESSSFPGALPLITLMIRHMVENKETLKHAIDRAVAVAANNGVPNMFCGVGQNSLGAKELHYLLRALGPIACRSPIMYTESIKKIMKLVIPNSRRGQLEEHIAPNSPRIAKVLKEMVTVGLDGEVSAHSSMEKLLNLLLGALVERYRMESEQGLSQQQEASKKAEDKKKNASAKKLCTPQSTLVRRLTGEHIDEEDMAGSLTATAVQKTVSTDDSTIKCEKYLLSQAVILHLLTELAKSYAAVARFIAEYVYHPENNNASKGQGEASILGFIFDKLLPPNKEISPPDTKDTKSTTVSSLARQFLSVLGSYWHNMDIQNIFVTELKGALSRALQLAECKVKHVRLQSIFNLITSMVETAAPISFSSSPPLQNISFIKMLIKRGLIADLARSTHSLDLSSQDLVATVNVLLKPLEKLSNLANSQFLQGGSKSEDKDSKQGSRFALANLGTLSSLGMQTDEDDEPGNQGGVDSSNINVTVEMPSTTQGTITSTNSDSIRDLEDIVEVMLGSNSHSNIFGETLVTNQPNTDDNVENRIYIETNAMVANSDSSDLDNSSDSDNNNDDISDNISEGNDDFLDEDNNLVPMDDTTGNVILESQVEGNENDGDGSQVEDIDSYDIISQETDDQDVHIEDTFLIGGGDEDEEERAAEEDDTDDEEGNDDDDDDDEDEDDEGSEMDADDNIAAADDAIIFGDDDEGAEDMGDPFADLDDNTTSLEISFPRRPLQMHAPQLVTELGSRSTAQQRSSILSHPLLLRGEQTTRGAPAQRGSGARNRTHRGDRVLSRQQGNTIHVHGNSNSGSFAQVLIGEDMRSLNQSDPGAFNEDVFFDIFGDANETASGLLNSVPSALSRWTVESRLLDGASVHDCVNSLKCNIVDHLEKLQEEELKEKVAEEKAKKEAEAEKKKSEEKANTEENGPSTTISADIDGTTSTNSSGMSQSLSTSSTTAATTITSAVASTTSLTPLLSAADIILGSEPMDISSSTSSTNEVPVIQPTAVAGTQTSSQDSTTATSSVLYHLFATPSLPPATGALASVIQQTPASSLLSRIDSADEFVTPDNPLPAVAPNAPQRAVPASTTTTGVATEVITQLRSTSSLDFTDTTLSSSALARTMIPQTPAGCSLSQRNSSGDFTANLGASTGSSTHPGTPGTGGNTESEASSLPSVASILQTPMQNLLPLIPEQLFPGSTAPTTSTSHDSVISPPQESDGVGTSALAADLAAAIMSQLVTSSPTPVVTTSAQTVDAGTTVSTTSSVATTSTAVSGDAAVTTTSTSSDDATADGDNETNPGPSGVLRAAEQIQRELEGLGIPEGVDPSFLAALPDSIREEVLREQFGIRLRSAETANSAAATSGSGEEPPQEISPEYLAALPPEVQNEVLEQQRLAQARYNAAQQRPEQPVDAAEFVRNLNPTLRRQVLADMDDTVLAMLPAELTSEAQGLRQEVEQRRMQLQAERTLTRSDFTQLLRHTNLAHRTPGGGFQFARLFPRGQMNSWRVTDGPNSNNTIGSKKIGRQLLDPESLTCLLVLLFLNDSTLNASRLHRILRNLSYHTLTKQWIIFALISILGRTSNFRQESNTISKYSSEQTSGKSHVSKKQKRSDNLLCEEVPASSESSVHNQWLSRTLNLAFGGCINIFQFESSGKSTMDNFVAVHQQACLDVCKQTLEALSFLAKNFPTSFSPQFENQKKLAAEAGPSKSKDFFSDADAQSDFWDILVRLNSSSSSFRGKGPAKTLKEFPKEKEYISFVSSPVGQILSMLSQSVVKQSTLLTDKLLRLLAVISMSLPERPKNLRAQAVDVTHHESGVAAQPPDGTDAIPIHTVTFADTDDVLTSTEQSVLPASDNEEEEEHAVEASTTCSETASVTSSLYVEPPEQQDSRILLPNYLRSSWTAGGSVVSDGTVAQSDLSEVASERTHRDPTGGSVLSDGTVAQSDLSEITGEHINAEHDSMDVDNARSDASSGDARSSPDQLSVGQLSPEKEPAILIGQLRMAVNVLTTGSCSDEGLDDATTLLLQLSRIEPLTRDCILELLLEGAQEIANTLHDEIKSLLIELKEHNATHTTTKPIEQSKVTKQAVPVIVNPTSSRSQPWRGRGGRIGNVVRRGGGNMGMSQQQQQSRRNVPKPIIYDLHLPTMAVLTAKRSCQSLFLLVLKVVLQLREAAQKSVKKPAQSRPTQSRSRGIRLIERLHSGGNNLREVVAALEADMEAMYEMIDRFGAPATSRSTTAASESTTTDATATENVSAAVTPAPAAPAADATNEPNSSTSDGDGSSSSSSKKTEETPVPQFARLSTQLNVNDLWDVLGEALTELAETTDTNAVLVLQPAVEAFFLVHSSDKEKQEKTGENKDNTSAASLLDIPPPSPLSPGINSSQPKLMSQIDDLPPDTQKFLKFAETHRTVLNQILRQSTTPLSDGPFAVLVSHTRLLDFDVKRRYFRQELEKEDKGHRREDMAVHIRREHVFEDSYRELHRRTQEELKNRLYIVFDGEEGQDAGGLLREWYGIMAREMFNPNYALFTISQGEKATYLPNRNSHCNPNHLSYFKFAGRVVAKAIYDNKLLDCYFTRSFYKHILGKLVHYTDMEAEDYGFYQGLIYLLEHDIDELGYELTFSLEMQVFGLNEVHDLKPNGRNIPVSEDTKREYVKLVCQEKMTASIRQQIDSFLEGFYEIIPVRLISIFDEQELELLIAGLPTIDIEDLKANTEYHKYTENSLQIQWFWRALRSFEQADRAKFLQFVTGTSKVPLQGFATLEGMNGVQKFQIHRDDRSTDRLPCAHTCFNQLDLPAYETYDKLHSQLHKAIQECPEGFGLA